MKAKALSKLLMIEQSLFSLPFALSGALLAFASPLYAQSFSHDPFIWVWIILAVLTARIAGMSFNRIIDRKIDIQNPRTQNRPSVNGEIQVQTMKKIAFLSSIFLIYCAYRINTICLFFSPLVLFLLWSYSYTKRFTPLCHFVLGLIQLAAPFFAWVSIMESMHIAPLIFGLAVFCLFSSMDILYAIQDLKFDRKMGLYSIPAKFGIQGSIQISQLLQILSVGFIIWCGLLLNMPYGYYIIAFIFGITFLITQIKLKNAALLEMTRVMFQTNVICSLGAFFTLSICAGFNVFQHYFRSSV